MVYSYLQPERLSGECGRTWISIQIQQLKAIGLYGRARSSARFTNRGHKAADEERKPSYSKPTFRLDKRLQAAECQSCAEETLSWPKSSNSKKVTLSYIRLT